jgi:hypothetical protein
VLERECEPAGLAMHAQAWRLPDPIGQRRVEHLHIHRRDVAPDPLLEDVDEEPSVPLRRDRAGSDDVAFLDVQRPIAP